MKKNILLYTRYITLTLITLIATILPEQSKGAEYSSESVLSKGRWVKIRVSESGMYQLTKSTLSGWGFSDISKVKVYGYGSAMISERMGDGYIDDLPLIPTYRDANKIIFYAQGPTKWKDIGASSLRITHTNNPYSVYGYYFITDSDAEATEIVTTGESATSHDNNLITSFIDYTYHEKDIAALANTGNALVGEDFKYTQSQNFSFNLTDRVENTHARVRVRFASKVVGGKGQVNIYSGEDLVSNMIIDATSNDNYAVCNVKYCDGTLKTQGEKINLNIKFSNNGILYSSRLDYITINYIRQLRMNGSSLKFRSFSTSCRDSVFSISNAKSDLVVWDITTQHNPKKVSATIEGNTAYFRQTESGKREYVAFTPSSTLPAPEYVEVVKNQNLHGTETPTMVIITPAEFYAQAERLAQMHRDIDSMKVEVVTDKAIYNEFSSGTPDAMAYRKLAKMWWERSRTLDANSTDRFRYMILFGRSVFDNRKLTSECKSIDYPTLITWECDNITSQSSSFNSDDVFCILEDNTDVSTKAGRLNIAVGRMPVKSVAEAKLVVDKLYKYVTNADPGPWKNNIMAIADDGDSGIHMLKSDSIQAELKKNNGEHYIFNRIYIDAFNSVSEGSGHIFPEAREQMLRNFRNGVLYASYIGHANPKAWTHNGLLTWTDIQNEYYYKHPAFIYTGTCEFTRWDDPEVSGGEIIYLKEQGGYIGMLTSSRATGISLNGELAAHMGRYLVKRDSNGDIPRIGDIIMKVKNERLGDGGHRFKYALIGDPAMRLKYPKHRVVVDEINGMDANNKLKPIEINARQKVTVKGHLEYITGGRITDVNGEVYATLYDAEQSVTTHGNYEGSDPEAGLEYTYDEWNNKLYDGVSKFENGEFEFSFIVPTEIANNYRPGLLSFYAASDDNSIDANGSTDNIYIFDFYESEIADTEGPIIDFMIINDESFEDGSTVNESPYIMAQFHDESGINISTAGIGHQMTLLLDNKTTIKNLEPYYSEDVDKVGTLNYKLEGLTEGEHTLRLRVWDTLGNASDKEITFNVATGLAPTICKVYSDANPASTSANFYLQHNRPDSNITVTISVYNMMGQFVWNKTVTGRSDMFTSMPVTWDLTDSSGCRVTRGIYLYQASITTDGINETTETQRIAVTGR